MAVQFDRLDDGQNVGDALTALVRSGKQPDDMTVLGGGSDPSQDVLAPEGR